MKIAPNKASNTPSDYPFSFSVFLITYNHESYIKEAIESILAQVFHEPVQIVIGVDRSTDATLQICRDYANKFKNIELIAHESNVGMFENFYQALKRCKGKYIAFLEGDDYWTDKHKLSQQFQYFEKKEKCILSAGLAQTFDQNSAQFSKPKKPSFRKASIFYKDEILLANRFATLTIAFRSSAVNWENLQALNGAPHLDWPFYLSLNYPPNGYAYRFNKVLGTYRMHSGGVYSQVSITKRLSNTAKTIGFIHKITKDLPYRQYLECLYVNFINKVAPAKTDLLSIYDPANSIYKDQKLTPDFLRALNHHSKNYLFSLPYHDFGFRAKLSLVHQTKSSYKIYLQFLLYPYIGLAIIKYRFFKLTKSNL